MTIKSTGRAPSPLPVSSAKPASVAKPAAAPARSADGFGTSSSFGSTSSAATGSAARALGNPDAPPVSSTSSAATGAGAGSVTPARTEAQKILGDIDGSTEALAKCFKTDLASQQDISKAIEELSKLAESGAINEDQFKVLNKALAMQVGLRGAADMSKTFLDKIMADLNKKPE